MQVSVEDVSGLTKKLIIVLPDGDVGKKLNAAFKKVGREVSVKGFRKGKIPRQVLEKNFGEKIRTEVADEMIQATYFDALEEVKLDAVVHPDVKKFNFADDGSFTYEAEVDIRPEFTLGKYKGLEVEQPEILVDDSLVDIELEILRKQQAPLKSVEDRTIENGDLIVIDFQGFHDGEAMQQVRGDDYSVDVGSARNGKEFEDIFLGLNKGEEASRTVDFPAGFANPVLAGKTIEFKITVKDVKERVMPELDDEFAKDVGEEFKTLDELKTHVKNTIREQKENIASGDLTDKLMLQILDAHDFEIPNRLVAYEINALIKETENNLERQSPGMTLEAAGISVDDLTEQYKESAIRRVKGDFLLKKIAEAEDITVTDDDLEKAFKRVADQYGMSVPDVKQYFRKREDYLPLVNELLSEKVLSFVKDATTIKVVAPETKSTDEESQAKGEGA